ncbi:MAG: Mov34/MPN/PAD-1 family protein [Nitrospira sp.]|nr:Mov34/MPN/PAD-1 family protein [Nitrospira sp.]
MTPSGEPRAIASVELSQPLIDLLFQRSEYASPQEMCGVLFSGDKFYQTSNTAGDPCHEFHINIHEYIFLCGIQNREPLALVHSHPTKGATSSVKDCRLLDDLERCGKDLAMVIVGLDPREIRVYKKRGHVYACEWKHIPVA